MELSKDQETIRNERHQQLVSAIDEVLLRFGQAALAFSNTDQPEENDSKKFHGEFIARRDLQLEAGLPGKLPGVEYEEIVTLTVDGLLMHIHDGYGSAASVLAEIEVFDQEQEGKLDLTSLEPATYEHRIAIDEDITVNADVRYDSYDTLVAQNAVLKTELRKKFN